MSDKKGLDLSGLDNFSDLMGGASTPTKVTSELTKQPEGYAGQLLMVPLTKIHKDPDNARKNLDTEKLKELADSMQAINPATGKPRGNKNPVSLRPHPKLSGEYILNAGERRCGAAELAGLSEVLAFIDSDADEFDNAVDNIQREPLSPLEMATFIRGRIDKGDKKSSIATRLGKSASFVSDHIIFFDMADSIRDLYDSGRVVSMQAMALLHRAHKKNPEEVEDFCSATHDELTTAEVRAFCDSLKEPANNPEHDQEDTAIEQDAAQSWAQGNSEKETDRDDQRDLTIDGEPISGGMDNNLEGQASAMLNDNSQSDKLKKALIQIQYDDRAARLLTNRRASYGFAWIKYDDDGHEDEVDLNEVKLIAIVEA